MAMIIQARYEQLDECASRFGRTADRTTRTLRQLHAGVEYLRASWQGAGAEAFLNEMEAEVLPATQRLVDALAESQRVTRRMAELLRAAEGEAAALFQSEPISGSAAIPFAAPLQQKDGGGKSRVERKLYKSPLEELIASQEDGAIPLGDILDEIRRASPAEQLAILNNPDYMALIEKRFGGTSEERVIVAALLEGMLFWPRGSRPDETGRIDITVENPWTDEERTNDFARWIRGEGPPPDLRRGNMNCWEYLMFSAYLTGDVSYDDLVDIHNAATNA